MGSGCRLLNMLWIRSYHLYVKSSKMSILLYNIFVCSTFYVETKTLKFLNSLLHLKCCDQQGLSDFMYKSSRPKIHLFAKHKLTNIWEVRKNQTLS